MSTLNTSVILKHSPDGAQPNNDGNIFNGAYVVSGNVFSEPIWVKSIDTIGIQVSCAATGTPNGSFAFQISNDQSMQESNAKPDVNLLNWSTQSFWDEATATWLQSKAVAGAASFMVTVPVLGGRWLRFSWTNTSGTANLIVKAQTKGDGGR